MSDARSVGGSHTNGSVDCGGNGAFCLIGIAGELLTCSSVNVQRRSGVVYTGDECSTHGIRMSSGTDLNADGILSGLEEQLVTAFCAPEQTQAPKETEVRGPYPGVGPKRYGGNGELCGSKATEWQTLRVASIQQMSGEVMVLQRSRQRFEWQGSCDLGQERRFKL